MDAPRLGVVGARCLRGRVEGANPDDHLPHARCRMPRYGWLGLALRRFGLAMAGDRYSSQDAMIPVGSGSLRSSPSSAAMNSRKAASQSSESSSASLLPRISAFPADRARPGRPLPPSFVTNFPPHMV